MLGDSNTDHCQWYTPPGKRRYLAFAHKRTRKLVLFDFETHISPNDATPKVQPPQKRTSETPKACMKIMRVTMPVVTTPNQLENALHIDSALLYI